MTRIQWAPGAENRINQDPAKRDGLLAEKRRVGWNSATGLAGRIGHKVGSAIGLRTPQQKVKDFVSHVASSPIIDPQPANWTRHTAKVSSQFTAIDIRTDASGRLTDARAHPPQQVTVSEATKQLLDIGNGVIAQVKQMLPHGSANQAGGRDSTAARETLKRTYAAQETAQALCQDDLPHPRADAAAALAFKAGTCDGLAALAYTLLRDRLPRDHTVTIHTNDEMAHEFPSFRAPGSTDAVVVDPWPLQAQAVRLQEHFCGAQGTNEVRIAKPGAQGNTSDGGTKLQKAQARADAIDANATLARTDTSAAQVQMRNQVWAGAQGPVNYVTGSRSSG